MLRLFFWLFERITAAVALLALMLALLLVVVGIWDRSVARSEDEGLRAVAGWSLASATVTVKGVAGRPWWRGGGAEVIGEFRYDWAGASLTGARFHQPGDPRTFGSFAKQQVRFDLDRLERQMQSHGMVTIRVNPHRPAEAVVFAPQWSESARVWLAWIEWVIGGMLAFMGAILYGRYGDNAGRALANLAVSALLVLGGLVVWSVPASELWVHLHGITFWRRVPAMIDACRLSSTAQGWQLETRYRYCVDGHAQIGTRAIIGRSGGGAAEGEYRRWLAELEAARVSGRPVEAYVHPRDAREATLRFRLDEAVLDLIFFGALLVFLGCSGIRQAHRNLRRELGAAPGWRGLRPWLAETDWQERTMTRNDLRHGLEQLFWSLVPFALLYRLRHASDERLIMVILAMLGGGLLLMAIGTLVRWWRFGSPSLTLSHLPIVPGDRCAGRLAVAVRPTSARGFRITIWCDETTRNDANGREGFVTRRRHEQTLMVPDASVRAADDRWELQFPIEIPPEVEDCDAQSNPTRTWRIEITTEAPGMGLHCQFTLPVFRVADRAVIEVAPPVEHWELT